MTAVLPRVMFVDDDVNLLRSLERALRSRRHVWDMAFIESAEAALGECAGRRFDAVVTDMSMPGMDGLDLVRALNQHSPAIRCIVLTGVADLQMATDIVNTARVFRFYTKPCPVDRLIAGIEEALRSALPEAAPGERRAADMGLLALDRLATAVVVVDGEGRVLHMNQAGGALVAERDGFAVDASQICRGTVARETQALHAAIRAQAAAGRDEAAITAVSLTRPSMRHALLVIVTPLGADPVGGGNSVALFVADPARPPALDAEVVGRLYGLTGAESRLACALASGHDLADAAQALNITMESARTYLKRIFVKTDTRRQAELVCLILASPAVMSRAAAHEPA
jgi:DNA-binding NarL/FixJ family response regulator